MTASCGSTERDDCERTIPAVMGEGALWERIRMIEADNERLTRQLAIRTTDRDEWKKQAIMCGKLLASSNTTVGRLQEENSALRAGRRMPSGAWGSGDGSDQ